MKRLIALVLVLGLVGGYVGATGAMAKKKKKKKPVPVAATYFLRDDNACESPNYLSKEDGPDEGCAQTDSMLNEALINQAGLFEEELVADVFEARDGVPFVLDATKALTGEVTTYSIDDLGVGQAEIDITVTGVSGGEQIVLGEQTDTFVVTPAEPNHTMELNLELDDALNKKKFESLTVTFYPHGWAAFHSGVQLDDPASFITLPTLAKKK